MEILYKFVLVYCNYQLLFATSEPHLTRPSNWWLGPHEVLHVSNISGIDFQHLILNTDCSNETLETNSEYSNCQIISDHLNRSYCYGTNTLITRTYHLTHEYEIMCTAPFPIEMEAKFQYGMPLPEKSRVVYERHVQNIYNQSTFIYVIRIFPMVSGNSAMARQIVKYYVRNIRNPGKEVIIFLSPTDIFEHWDTKIDTSEKILNFPCVSNDDTTIHLYKSDGYNEYGEAQYIKIPEDRKAIIYNHIVGFLINTTEFDVHYDSAGFAEYICTATENPDGQHFRSQFTLKYKKESQATRVTPDTIHVILFRNTDFNLACDDSEAVLITGIIDDSTYDEGFRNIDSGDVVYNEFEETTAKRFSAYYSNHHNFNASNRYASILCQSSNDKTVLHTWYVQLVDIYDQSNRFLKLENEEEGSKIKCTSYRDIVKLRNIICNNPAMCALTQKCLEEGSACTQYIPGAARCLTTDDESCQVVNIVPHGLLKCSAGPYSYSYMYFQGFDGKYYTNWRTAPEAAIISITGGVNLHTNDAFIFTCRVHSFVSGGKLQFLERRSDSSLTQLLPQLIQNEFEIGSIKTLSNPTEDVTVWINNVSLVEIVCTAPIWDTEHEWINVSLAVKVTESQLPTIKNEDTTKLFKLDGLNQNLICEANGFPRPHISWTRDGQVIQDPLHEVDNVISKILYFSTYNESMSGEYVCSARNVAGNKTQSFFVNTEEATPDGFPWIWVGPLVGVGCALLLMLIPGIIVAKRLKAVQWAIQQLSEEEVQDFFNGTLGASDDTSEGDMEPGHLPFDIAFQIQKEDMFIDKNKILGMGEFGIVYGGRLETNSQEVAFKTAQQDLSGVAFRALLAELKIMNYIGQHPNLVQLLGAYVAEIRRGILYIATEFCHLGSLESFLRKNSGGFDGECDGHNMELENILGTSELWSWAHQIATGMEYLTNRKVIHSDLATRNVLLNKDRVAKITDFGLSRKLYERTIYVKTSEEPLPWRWLAVESIRQKTFSAQSDVWAFGITLWEIFSLGEVPYPGINWTADFNRQLEMGLRNLRPAKATEELYAVMTNCWELDPGKRPTFTELRDFLLKQKPNTGIEGQYADYQDEEHSEYSELGFESAVKA